MRELSHPCRYVFVHEATYVFSRIYWIVGIIIIMQPDRHWPGSRERCNKARAAGAVPSRLTATFMKPPHIRIRADLSSLDPPLSSHWLVAVGMAVS